MSFVINTFEIQCMISNFSIQNLSSPSFHKSLSQKELKFIGDKLERSGYIKFPFLKSSENTYFSIIVTYPNLLLLKITCVLWTLMYLVQ